MFNCSTAINDLRKEAVETYESDITGLVTKEKAKYGYITTDSKNNKQEIVTLWESSVKKQNKEDAQSWFKKVAIFRIALIITLVAAVILTAIAIAGVPLVGVAAAAAIGYTAIAFGVGFVGSLIPTIIFNCKFRKLGKDFGKQYVRKIQQLIMEKPKENKKKAGDTSDKKVPDLTLESIPHEQRQTYANKLVEHFKKHEYKKAKPLVISDADILRRTPIPISNPPPEPPKPEPAKKE